MTTEEDNNKMTLRRFFEAIDRKDVTSLDHFVSTSFVDHNPLSMPGMASGFEGLKQAFVVFLAAFPDLHHGRRRGVPRATTSPFRLARFTQCVDR